jgi:pimeloyl-ACP methyl ester carboxylesterase
MADRAGIAPGDVVESIDGKPITGPHDLRRALMEMGDVAIVGTEPVAVDRRSLVEGVEYGELDRGVRLRTLVRGSGALGVLFLQGIAPTSVEDPSPITDLLHALPGITLLELERRGVGDSEGEVPDFVTEVDDYRAALAELRKRCERVVLFGHSVGGMVAPLLGAVDGIIVYGTSPWRWSRCLEASTRRQLALHGITDVEPVLTREREKIARGEDERSAAFHAQLDAVDLAAAWQESTCPRLVLHGEYDWIVSEEEARAIDRDAVIIPELDHAMTAHDSLRASLKALGRGRRVKIPEIAAFLDRVRRAPSAV